MSVEWKLTCAAPAIDATFAALDITSSVLSLESCAPDRLTLTHEPDNGFIAAALLPYNSICTITRDAEPVFSGRCRTIPRAGTMPTETIRYEILGPWLDLEQITFGQRWKTRNSATGALEWQYKNRYIIGQAESGAGMTSGAVIAEVVDFAAANGANLICGNTDGWPTMRLPWEEITNLKCADVIVRMLAFCPDYKVRFDYTEPVPVFNLVRRSTAPAISLAIGTDDIQEISITPRHDISCPGVRIHFERTADGEDATYDAFDLDEAGEPASADAITATIPMAGSGIGGGGSPSQTARIVSRLLPVAGGGGVNWLDKDWWLGQAEALRKYAPADVTLTACEQTVEPPADGEDAPDLEDMHRELIDGTVPPWLAGDVATARVSLTLKYNYIDRREADGKQVAEVKEATLVHSLVLTAVPTGTYRRAASGGANAYEEPSPLGLAASLYQSWQPLQYDGTVVVEEEDVGFMAAPGDVLNLTGGLAAWATMRAHIQQVHYEIENGRTTIIVGPAKRVDPPSLGSLLRRLRSRGTPFNHLSRTTGKRQNLGDVETGGIAQDKKTTAAPGVPQHQTIPSAYDPDAPYTTEIDLDPAAIIPPDAATRTTPVIIKPRIIQTVERQGNALVRVQRSYLVSDPVTDPVEIDPDEPGGGGPEDPTDDDTCDQNDHPGDDDNDGPPGYNDDHPGDGDAGGGGGDYDDDHPGDADCYTTSTYT
jgi:hypothetical protein